MPKLKREEAECLAKSERQKLQRLYTQGCAANESVRNLVKASNLSVSKVRQFLHSKPSYTKFTLATSKFKRMKAFARFKLFIWCMDLAYVVKLGRKNNGVSYLLVRQDLFNKTVRAMGIQTKGSEETVRALLTMLTKTNRPTKLCVGTGTEVAGEFEISCEADRIPIYSILSGIEAAFAERTIRSLKKILHRYMED